MNKKVLSILVLAAIGGFMAGTVPAYAEEQLDEVIVYGDKYKNGIDQDSAQVKPLAAGLVGTK